MNNFLNHNIVIVAPDQYSDLARRISHEISSKDGFHSSYWTIKHFKDNEFATSSKQHAIFIGTPEENELTKVYFPIINAKLPNHKAGIYYGFDDTKAIVYGDGNLKQVFEFKRLYNDIKKGEIKVDGETSKTNKKISYIISAIASGVIGVGLTSLLFYVNKKKKEKKFRKVQTELALALFLTREFNIWFNIKTETAL